MPDLVTSEEEQPPVLGVPSSARNTTQFGVIVFLASDVMLFAPFFAASFLLRATNQPWPPEDVHLDVPRALVATLVLVASSFTLVASDRAGERPGGARASRRWLLVTIALGLAFLVNQLLEYRALEFGADSHPGSSTAFGSVSPSAIRGSSNGNNFGLVKQGVGILNLTGTNSYRGNTTVNGGTLQILLANLATNSTVSVATGAVLRLDFITTNTVTGFVTNGVALAPGVYNAGNVVPFIAGSGSLKVAGIAPPPPPPTIAPVTVSGTNLVLSAATVLGANYILQSATNLVPTINWQNESTNPGTGGSLILNVPIDPSQPQKFLRFWVY